MTLSRIKSYVIDSTLEIIPGVYQLTTRGANIVAIAEKELTLIDTGFPGSASRIIRFIRRLGRSAEEISLIIITHNHIDHAGGVAELKRLTGARVAAHQGDLAGTTDHIAYPVTVRRLLNMPPFSALGAAFSVNAGEIDIPLSGGESLPPLGGLRVIPTPGHTPGSISLFSDSYRLLFAGDALNNRRRFLRLPPKHASTDLAQAADSVIEMSRLNFDILCLGHGQPLSGNASRHIREMLLRTRMS